MNASPLRRHRGFSLIEVLVGLLIAMIAVVIMMEVLATSEQRVRTSNSGNDAMSGAAVMMHMLQQDLVQAGYGISSTNMLGCSLQLPPSVPAAGKLLPMVPAVIYKAGDTSTVVAPQTDINERNTTDRLLVMYGSDSSQPEGNSVVAAPAGDIYSVASAPLAYKQGDWVVAWTGSCATPLVLTQVAAPPGTNDVTVTSGTGLGTAVTTLYNLGSNPHFVAYAIRNNALTTCDYMAADCSNGSAANWTALGGNIVALRAQYGRDISGAATVSVTTWDQNTPADSTHAQCAPAVRFVLVAKGSNYESQLSSTGQRTCEAVTAAAPQWQGSVAAGNNPTPLSIDLSRNNTVSDWQCYRYRTFENIAPSRNTVWMSAGSCPNP